MYFETPILFLVFNRPDLTERVFLRIREIRPTCLFVAADGPRSNRPDEIAICQEVRDIFRRIDWDCDVHTLFRDENLGCKVAVSSAITWFFENVEEGIILEDDCVPDSSFFEFCAMLLARYRTDDRVALISGDNFQSATSNLDHGDSYYFSRYPHIWGWASWRRFWKDYDVEISGWNGDGESLSDRIPGKLVRDHWQRIFNCVRDGKIDTWDFQLAFECIHSGRLVAIPRVNLVENDGFDERATHTVTRESHSHRACTAMRFPLIHPHDVAINEKADRYTEKIILGIGRPGLARWVRSALGKLKRMIKH